jgi:hypothetical protein
MLKDLSLIALTYSKLAGQQRLTFKPNPKGENSAPVVFQHDPNGDLVEFVLDLRSLSPIAMTPLLPIKEDDEDKLEASKTFEVETQSEKAAGQQKSIVDEWVKDEDHRVTDVRILVLFYTVNFTTYSSMVDYTILTLVPRQDTIH